ncbi:MAG: hypothetical protein UH824_03585 [Acutalibacteraceae bacterium]|nr:hypothetical protein [Acutalibacteraceae bacterium]
MRRTALSHALHTASHSAAHAACGNIKIAAVKLHISARANAVALCVDFNGAA